MIHDFDPVPIAVQFSLGQRGQLNYLFAKPAGEASTALESRLHKRRLIKTLSISMTTSPSHWNVMLMPLASAALACTSDMASRTVSSSNPGLPCSLDEREKKRASLT